MVALEQLLSPQVIVRLGWTLVHFVWQAAAVAVLLAVVLRILRRRSASMRYIAACLALVLIVVLPVVTILLVKGPEPVAEAGPALTPTPIVEATPMEVIEVAELPAMSVDAIPVEAAEVTVQVPWTQRAAEALEPALPYLVAGWLLGVFGLSTWHLGGWAQLQRMKRRMVCAVAAPLQAKLADLASALGVRRAVALLESALVEVPTVVGWIKPVILLPASALSGLSTEQLEAILAHELAHIRRYDYLVNIVQTVVEILGFYHPALWWISHKIRTERENCCDDLAVQVCGDSVRYARALTCLEEMRHRGTELAVAASGGSLVARIGRLLGRPTTDNRRFAWLPGLIALLLVVATLIPTALVLAAPEVSDHNTSSNEQQDESTESQSPRQVVLSVLLGEFSPEETLDRDTAIRTRNLLADATKGSSFQAPRVEELQKPLWHVLDEYVDDPNVPGATAKAIADLLIATGQASVLSTPELLTCEGRYSRLVIGGAPGSDVAAGSDRTDQLHLTVEMMPTVQEDSDTILFSTKILGKNVRIRNLRDDRLGQMTSVTVDYKWSLRNDEYSMIPFSQIIYRERADLDKDAGVLFLLVRPSITGPAPNDAATEPATVYIPLDPPDDTTPSDNTGDGNKSAVEAKVLAQTETEGQSGPPIRIETIFANVQPKKVLDRETKRLIGEILATEYPQMADLAAQENVTLGEILRRYVAGKHLPSETMEALTETLASRGYLEIEAAPSIQTRDNVSAQVKISREMPIVADGAPASSAQYIDLGFTVQATPHLASPAADRITLEIEAQWTELAEETPAGELPAVHTTEMASTMTLPKNRFFALLMEPDDADSTPSIDRESKLVLFRAHCINRPAEQQSTSVPPAPQGDGQPRQVLLDSRIVSIDEPGLANLGFEWRGGIDFVYASNQSSTDSLLSALNLLQKNGLAEVVSNPQVLAQDGKISELGVTTEEYYMLAPPARNGDHSTTEMVKIESGTKLAITPRIGDDGDITLEIVTEISDSIPSATEAELPVVTRRKTRNVTTVKNGGTVALAGVGAKDVDTQKQLVILVTASLAPETPTEPSKPGQSAQVRMQAQKTDNEEAAPDDQTPIVIDTDVFTIPSNRPLTAEAAARLSRLWDEKIGSERRASLPRAEALQVSPQELLARCTEDGQGDAEALAIMRGLLVSLEYVRVTMNPRVTVRNGEWAEISSKQHVPDPTAMPGAPGKIECRTVLKLSAQADSASRITLDVAANITDLLPSDGPESKPHIATYSLGTKAVVGKDKTLVLRLAPTTEGKAQESDTLYLLVRPRIAPPEPASPPDTVTATFKGEDLRRALEEVAAQTGVNITCHANVAGRVWGTLQDVSVEKALEIILAGSPFVVREVPNGYTIADKGEPPAEPASPSGTVTATFEPGDDLRQALKEIGERAGVPVICDPNVSGTVQGHAEFHDVSLEAVLEPLLAGTPFVVTKEPDYYLVTTRDVIEKAAISVEARFVVLDKALMEALQSGLPIEGVTRPEDVNALHAIGADLLADKTPLLEPTQVGMLLGAVRRYAGSKSLAAPKPTVLDGEPASFTLTNSLDYVSGYREPNDASGEPVPLPKSKDLGVRLDVTPKLIENNNVRVAIDMEINSLLDMQTAMYQGTYEYDIPTFQTVTIESEIVIPDGHTALVRGGEIRSLDGTRPSKDQPDRHLIILIKPRKTEISPASRRLLQRRAR